MGVKPMNLDLIRERLASRRGQEYWRALEELAESEEFQYLLKQEAPQHVLAWEESLDRRGFRSLAPLGRRLARPRFHHRPCQKEEDNHASQGHCEGFQVHSDKRPRRR